MRKGIFHLPGRMDGWICDTQLYLSSYLLSSTMWFLRCSRCFCLSFRVIGLIDHGTWLLGSGPYI